MTRSIFEPKSSAEVWPHVERVFAAEGVVTRHALAASAGIVGAEATTWLVNWCERGYVERVAKGRYVVCGRPASKQATTAEPEHAGRCQGVTTGGRLRCFRRVARGAYCAAHRAVAREAAHAAE
jgi:predicted transcriptional regulator of viral defense system